MPLFADPITNDKLSKVVPFPKFSGSAVHYMKGSEVWEVKLTILNVVSPVASISLLIGSDVHHFVFTVYHKMYYTDFIYVVYLCLKHFSSALTL